MHPDINIKLIRSCPNVNTNSDQILIKSGIVRDQRIDCTCCPCIFFCFFSNLIPNGFSFPIPNILIYSFENLGCVRLPRGSWISVDFWFPWMAFLGGVRLRQNFPWMIKIHGNSLFAWIFSRPCFFVDFFMATRYAILHITHSMTATCQHHPLRKKPLGRIVELDII